MIKRTFSKRSVVSLLSMVLFVLPVAGWAEGAGTTSQGVGVGIATTLTGQSGPTVSYQTGRFHFQGLVGFHDDGETRFDLAGRGFFQLHSTSMSDFGIGGGLGYFKIDQGDNEDSDVVLELGVEIRVFLVPQVAFGSSIGLSFVDDMDTVDLRGQLMGQIGLTYFFF